MSVIADLPAIRPSLLLDFANSRRLHPLIQHSRASTATCYGPDGKLRTVGLNVPRIDFDPSTGRCLGLLVEGARTNLLTGSNDFSGWLKNRVVADSAPDAEGWTKITEDTSAASTHVLARSLTPTGGSTTYSWSIDVKAGTRRYVGVEWGSYANQVSGIVVYVDLQTGSISSGQAGRIQVVKIADGEFRISVTTTTVSSPTGTLQCNVYLCNALGTRSYDGDGSSHLYVRNSQAEVGDFPSSYIPTLTTTVTRAADVLVIDAYEFLASNGFSICLDGMSDYVVEYPCILSDSSTTLGNYVGPRAGTSGCYINSTEGGRSAALPRPAAGSWMRIATAIANDASGGVGLDGVAGAGAARTAVDFKQRRYLKFGTVSSAAGGVWRIGRLAIYRAILSAAQLQRITAA